MLETSVYEYYAFGYNYRVLRYDLLGNKVKGGEGSLEWNIGELIYRLDSLSLQVTHQAASKLKDIRRRLDEMPDDATVDRQLANEIEDACDEFDVTLDAELKLRTAFVALPGRFNTDHLLEQPEALLGNETLPRLPDIALFDFSQACRAVAFGLATAAAFHLMRCVEALLRDYYQSIVKQKRVRLMWFDMVEHLRKRRRDAPPKTMLDHLDHIRVNFRNPTQHPDARYELEEAQDLLSLSIDALNRMARDLAERESTS